VEYENPALIALLRGAPPHALEPEIGSGDDGLAPARGLLFALLIAIISWAAVAVVVWVATKL
jgi:hypothetical protein